MKLLLALIHSFTSSIPNNNLVSVVESPEVNVQTSYTLGLISKRAIEITLVYLLSYIFVSNNQNSL